jgi:hypothetical protein
MRLLLLSFVLTGLAVSAVSAQEAGWETLFNGRDLTGWTGDVDGYGVENGVLFSRRESGGNLYFDREFSDFVLRFSFRLEEGGNNGVGIRAEKGKDAAYYGMEIQILDDYAARWANLEPWQYHGSIYGVVAARRGALRPTGEWNEQEIRAEGSRIRVTLNGTVIVDADLREAGLPSTVDGRPHPGLFNPSGYIGFLGHGHRVEFRDIRILERATAAQEGPVRHVVVFKYRAGASAEDIRRVTEAFAALQHQIPGIVAFEHGVNDSPEGRDLGFTHVYLMTFQDRAARDAYLPHPEHQRFGQFLGSLGILEDVFVVDYVPAN